MLNDLNNKTVLITGGTMGIGFATGLAFAKHGAQCILTYKWGSVELDDLEKIFRRENARLPLFIQSDVAESEDTDNLMDIIKQRYGSVDIYISNVSFAQLTKNLSDYSERGLFKSIEYSVWPLVEFIKRMKAKLNSYPRYIVGLSSNGPDAYHVNYDFVASSKAILETLIRYLNYRLIDYKVNINVVRARFVKTQSLWATCGEEFKAFGEKYNTPGLFIEAQEVADAILALCSGLMDGVSGEVLNIDKGSTFADNIMRYYEEREALGMDLGLDN